MKTTGMREEFIKKKGRKLKAAEPCMEQNTNEKIIYPQHCFFNAFPLSLFRSMTTKNMKIKI